MHFNPTILSTGDVFTLHDVINYVLTRAQVRSQTAVQLKVPLGHVLQKPVHSDAIMTSLENVMSQPNTLHDTEH